MPHHARLFATAPACAAALLAGLLLGGCAAHKTTTTARTGATSAPATASHAGAAPASVRKSAPAARAKPLPERTGIAACDDYLASYIGCHRAAGIFAPGQLQDRYEAMRNSLLRDAQNPDIRPQLAARCNSLATQLRTALHGKACEVSPAPAASSSP